MSRSQRISYAQIPSQADEAHMQDTRGASQYIARYINVTPNEAEWPVTLKENNKIEKIIMLNI